ncbi:MAG TPA: hypothetical protein VE871_04465 [Longimicrobium sp.]|nr:hypothetical protein [Longimicrobium sp.]
MRRAILFCLLAIACGPDAPSRPPEIADSIEPPATPSSAPALPSLPDPADADTFVASVPPSESRSLAGECHPNYDPCVPIDDDVDCAGGRGNGPSYATGPVRVTGIDVYDLDRDGDGTGCDR